jgi:rhodanese-related sulfurtransferase
VAFEIIKDGEGEVAILDLRSAADFSGPIGHLRGAQNLPLVELDQRLAELHGYRNRTLLVVCDDAACGEAGTRLLQTSGFPGALMLEGGIAAWLEKGFGTVGSVSAPVAGAAAVLASESPGSPAVLSVPAGSVALRLADGGVILPPRVPEGLFVVGRLVGGRFVAGKSVEGSGELCDEYRARTGEPGTDGYIELADGRFFPVSAKRPPSGRIVSGCRGADALFRPYGREIG